MERGKTGMNAYRNYKKNQGLAKAREILDDNMDRYIEHVELLFLYIMNVEFKHKPKDLYKFVDVFHEYLFHFRKRFVLDGDDTRLYGKEKRMDVFALREILKEIGFDYDEACDRAKKLIDEHMEEEANEHHAE